MYLRSILFLCVFGLVVQGCWDPVEHVYDCEVGNGDTGPGDGPDTESEGETDGDVSEDAGISSDSKGQGALPQGWDGFGAACDSDDDCTGYPSDGRCIENVLGMIDTPGGYCTACCNAAATDGCAEGIDCVGVDDVFLVCLARCQTDADCRQNENYECRPIYYLDSRFKGNYCLPDQDHVTPEEGAIQSDPHCDWPWL